MDITDAAVATTERTPALARAGQRRTWFRQSLHLFMRRPIAVAGALLILLLFVIAGIGPEIVPYEPQRPDFAAVLQGPSAAHWLGTDDLGRDILTRLVFGARTSLRVSLTAVIIAVAIGVALGLLTGYLGGIVDEGVMRALDSLMALPSLVLALTIAAVLGPGINNAMIAIAVTAVPTYARLVRGQTLSVKENDYVLAARAVGVATPRIIGRHIFPNTVSPIIVQASLGVGFAIITESSLSFIGLGAQPPTPTWGSMVQVGFQFLETAPWYVLAPAGMIFVAVLGFNLLGDGLRDALDPTMRHT